MLFCGLVEQAAATRYCRPALRALGDALPVDDGVLHGALDQAADARDAKAFSHLYLASLLAGRRVPASVLELGAGLLPHAMLMMHTAGLLDGDVVGGRRGLGWRGRNAALAGYGGCKPPLRVVCGYFVTWDRGIVG